MPYSLRGLYDKKYCFTSDVMYKKYKRLVYTPSDLLARICKVNLSNAKKCGLICFPRICFRGLIYYDQEPLWLLNVIEDVCYFLGVHTCIFRLSTRCKMFHSKITYPFPQKSHECAHKLTDLWITSLLFDLKYNLLMGASLLALAKSIYYSDRKPRAYQKLGNGPRLANARPPGSAKFVK